MTNTIEIYINHAGDTHRVGRCRYVAKRRGQSSVFEYADEWLANPNAFAIDPANLPWVADRFTLFTLRRTNQHSLVH